MKINEQLVKKVQDREAKYCIEHTRKQEGLPLLKKLLLYSFPYDEDVPAGLSNYYYAIEGDLWNSSNLVGGMTPIPLKDFFVEEVEEKPERILTMKEFIETRWGTVDDVKVSPSPSVPVDKVEGEASGIKEFDELMVQYRLNKISLIEFASSLWNKGYNEGKKEHSKHSIIN